MEKKIIKNIIKFLSGIINPLFKEIIIDDKILYTSNYKRIAIILYLNNYLSKNNKLLNNHRLYKEFYRLIDQLDLKLVKVSGHQAFNKKEDIDIFFTLVDKASRKAMKEDRGIKKGNDIKSQFLNTS